MERLSGVVQDYAWGHPSFIAELLETEAEGPQAEYWLGAHERGPSTLIDGGGTLADYIKADPKAALGDQVVASYGKLPFLLKILAASKSLSIQCHPSKRQAEAGFAEENAAGVPLDSPQRVYRDDNHKPELICAITPFEAKVGFRPVVDTLELLGALRLRELDGLVEVLSTGKADREKMADALEYLLSLSAEQATSCVRATVAAAEQLMAEGSVGSERFASELEWTPKIDQDFPDDIGVVVALLLNHVRLEPHQSVGLQAGNLHCYLAGVGVELMANSDNVVRCALTPKHVAVTELLEVVDTEPGLPSVDTATGPNFTFSSPAPEFRLGRILSVDGQDGLDLSITVDGPEIWLVTEGVVQLQAPDGVSLQLSAGEACFVSAEDDSIELSGKGCCWRAGVGSAIN